MVVDDVGGCCLHFQIWKEVHFSMKIYNEIGGDQKKTWMMACINRW